MAKKKSTKAGSRDAQPNADRGPSPGSEIDAMATSGPKTKWQEPHMPAAGDPVTELEREGLNLLGQSSVRDGAISGVSDPTATERTEQALNEDRPAARLDEEGGSPAE